MDSLRHSLNIDGQNLNTDRHSQIVDDLNTVVQPQYWQAHPQWWTKPQYWSASVRVNTGWKHINSDGQNLNTCRWNLNTDRHAGNDGLSTDGQSVRSDGQSLNNQTYHQRKSDDGIKDVWLGVDVAARSVGPDLQQLFQNVVVGEGKVGSLRGKKTTSHVVLNATTGWEENESMINLKAKWTWWFMFFVLPVLMTFLFKQLLKAKMHAVMHACVRTHAHTWMWTHTHTHTLSHLHLMWEISDNKHLMLHSKTYIYSFSFCSDNADSQRMNKLQAEDMLN